MKRVGIFFIICVLCLAMLPSGASAAYDVGDASVDLYAASLVASVPNPGNFNYNKAIDGTPVTLTLDCEVDDNNVADDITTLIHIHGHLYSPSTYPMVLGFDQDNWCNPSTPGTDDTTNWPLGQTASQQLSISFGNPPTGYFIEVKITADIYSEAQDDTDHDEIEFTVTIL